MGRFWRRIRGIIGTAVTWAVGWAGIGGGLSFFFPGGLWWAWALSAALEGLVAGGAFAVIFGVAERKHTLEELSLRRVAVWGAVGGLLLGSTPLLLGAPPTFWVRQILTLVVLSSGSATGSVALARQARDNMLAEGDEPSLLGGEGE